MKKIIRGICSWMIHTVNGMAQAWLLVHDDNFRLRYIQHEVVRLREEVRRNNGSQDDLDAIDVFSVKKALGFDPW